MASIPPHYNTTHEARMSNILTIAWLTFHEARRRRIVVAVLGLGIICLLLFAMGLSAIQQELESTDISERIRQNTYMMLLIAGLTVVHMLTIMMSIFASVDTISGEIMTHTIHTIVTKPVQRWHIIMGKWLGYACMLGLVIVLLAGGMILVTALMVGYIPPNIEQGLALLFLEALVLLSLSFLGGTCVSTMTNGIVLFLLYGVAFIGSWVEQIGALLQSGAAVRIGIITSLLLPVEALWRRVAYVMQPPIVRELPMSPFSTSSLPSEAMVIYAIVYACVALGLAIAIFQYRDLS